MFFFSGSFCMVLHHHLLSSSSSSSVCFHSSQTFLLVDSGDASRHRGESINWLCVQVVCCGFVKLKVIQQCFCSVSPLMVPNQLNQRQL